jgi:hypothetical protein
MRRLVRGALIAGLFVLVSSTGCISQIPVEQAYWDRTLERSLFQEGSMTQSTADRMHLHRQVIDEDARAIIDDIDYVLLRDRPSRLSRWHNR